MSVTERKYQYVFATQYLKKDPRWWNDVTFADDSKFKVFESEGGRMV